MPRDAAEHRAAMDPGRRQPSPQRPHGQVAACSPAARTMRSPSASGSVFERGISSSKPRRFHRMCSSSIAHSSERRSAPANITSSIARSRTPTRSSPHVSTSCWTSPLSGLGRAGPAAHASGRSRAARREWRCAAYRAGRRPCGWPARSRRPFGAASTGHSLRRVRPGTRRRAPALPGLPGSSFQGTSREVLPVRGIGAHRRRRVRGDEVGFRQTTRPPPGGITCGYGTLAVCHAGTLPSDQQIVNLR